YIPDIRFDIGNISHPELYAFGFSVSSAGDVNNDSYPDIIIGAPPTSSNLGKAHIYFGGENMDNISDVVLMEDEESRTFGSSVSSAGDVNGDGYDDVIVGAYSVAGTLALGKAYIFFGGNNMDKIADVVLSGIAANENFGSRVAKAGDLNKDGTDDVIVSAPFGNKVYVYFGGTVSIPMDPYPDLIISESGSLYFGFGLAGDFDINGDSYPDIAIGAFKSYKVSVYLGSNNTDNSPDYIFIGKVDSYFGFSAGTSDFNGDGIDDLLVGAKEENATGRAYLYSFSYGVFAPSIGIENEVIWEMKGYFIGDLKIDFLDELKKILPSCDGKEDKWKNLLAEIRIKINCSNGYILLSNLSIIYEYEVRVELIDAIKNYIKERKTDYVPIRISSESSGRIIIKNINFEYKNEPPKIYQIPALYVTEGSQYLLDLSAFVFDEDKITITVTSYFAKVDGLIVELFYPVGLKINSELINITVFDGINYVNGSFLVYILRKTVQKDKPNINFSIQNGSTLSGKVKLSGTATGNISKLMLRIDGEEWIDIKPGNKWSYEIDTKKIDNGKHTISLRAIDANGEYTDRELQVNVENKKEMSVWIIILIIVLLACIGICICARPRKEEKPPEQIPEIPKPLPTITKAVDLGGEICPICMGAIKPGSPKTACNWCKIPFHQSCANRLVECPKCKRIV
ncbi:MAG: Ig-like domain-containing protein, partial [Candidatus Thermoplasmatota archaeon]